MQKMIRKISAIVLLLTAGVAHAQISIVNTNLSSLNVTPEALCQVNILNGTSSEMQVTLEAKLLNSTGENVLVVKTNPFRLVTGMNNGFQLNYSIQSSIYSGSGQAGYIRTTHTLPSGNFKYCVSVVALSAEGGDDYCEDMVSDISSFLNLVFPYDKDTIDTPYPLLTWTHSEPFNILAQGEYFRMIVVELSADQGAESGIAANNPVYFKNYLFTHQDQYPFDAKELQDGKRYGWQVQKISNGTVIDKTEAWEFTLRKSVLKPDNKYSTLKKKHDGSFYVAQNDKIFFRFEESYVSGELKCRILDEKRNEIKPEVTNEKSVLVQTNGVNVKSTGANYYEIDLQELKLKPGYYELEVINAKKEKFVLRFQIEK
ncbi:MAG: hypothetical protein ACK40M_06295 [Flavobacteriales bacterium]